MKTKYLFTACFIILHSSFILSAHAQGTGFTYQGRLAENDGPASGSYDLQFSLRDAAVAGNLLGVTNSLAAVAVSNGLFTVLLDFGPGVFSGGERWLVIGVKSNGVAGAHTSLTPRQPITPSPYAIFAGGAQTASTVATGGVNAAALTLGAVGSGAIADDSIQPADLSATLLHGTFWRLGGNTGTTPGVNFLGTADDQALELKVNGTRALRMEPNTNGTPNLIGGFPGNVVDLGVFGATIGGGGAALETNRIATTFGTIGGGAGNLIESFSQSSTIGGGRGNIIQTTSPGSTIAGGEINLIGEDSFRSVIGGGFNNHVEKVSRLSTIGGGIGHRIQDFAEGSTIGGGKGNTIDVGSISATIGGGEGNTIQTNVSRGVIGGGNGNVIQTDASFAAIGGGSGNAIQRAAQRTTISGGRNNTVFSNATSSAIGGGFFNQILAGADYATIPGGTSNSVAGEFGFAAGQRAKANHTGTFVWADAQGADFASTGSNQFLIRASSGVGIGTATPSARLTVAGAGAFNNLATASVLLDNTSANGHRWQWHALDAGGMQVVDFTAGLARLLIDTNGSVGLGETSPSARLDVRTALARVALFNRTGDDGVLVNWQRDGINVGSVTVAAGVVSYTAFTGSHYAWTEEAIGREMLVAMTGDNRRAAGGDTSEIIYGVTQTQTANDPRCLGAYLGLEEPSHPASDQNPHQIMSVGNGELWVTASGGDLEPGDALITSALPGCAMKDDSAQFPIGHIIARAADRVDWATVPADSHGVKRTKISVLFTNYERHTGGTALAALQGLNQKMEETRAENAELKRELSEIKQLLLKLSEKKD